MTNSRGYFFPIQDDGQIQTPLIKAIWYLVPTQPHAKVCNKQVVDQRVSVRVLNLKNGYKPHNLFTFSPLTMSDCGDVRRYFLCPHTDNARIVFPVSDVVVMTSSEV